MVSIRRLKSTTFQISIDHNHYELTALMCSYIMVFFNNSKVNTDNNRQAVLVWDFIVKDELQPASTVKALLPKEDEDSYPTLPWLDITT